MTVEPTLDENALSALQDMFAKVDKGEAKERKAVHDMITDTEDTIGKSSRQRVRLVMDQDLSKKREERMAELKLRSLEDGGKSEKGLERRFNRMKKDGKAEGVSIKSLRHVQIDLEDQKDDYMTKRCFHSYENSLEATKISLDELLKLRPTGDLPIEKIVALFGLVGVPVSHKVDNYTDPMNIGINGGLLEVTPSDQTHLNQKSLWSLSGTDYNQNLVQHTGSKMTVTAVIPIRLICLVSKLESVGICIFDWLDKLLILQILEP